MTRFRAGAWPRQHSWLQPPADALGHLATEPVRTARTRVELLTSEPQDWRAARSRPSNASFWIRESAFELPLEAVHEGRSLRRIHTVKYKAIDGHVNATHDHPRISLSTSARSVLIASCRVA